ncbi:hypothetical protein Y032_0062g3394 [Ancylostoma ceylanicum]|uniref:Uncharacterized protein n=1 Tax=Ancylostoma ceylanicum TaxID=53326 RepID=A0A016U2G8_9BILA|nr:hypothetical protein Y032_0062g3394 [Ancylostoma ceylanicum]
MPSAAASQLQKRTRRPTAVESEDSTDGTPDNVAKALEQLRADKKTPVFLKTLINHMVAVQEKLSSVLLENQELHQQVNNLRDENNTLKRALAEAENRLSSPASAREINLSTMASDFEEKERLRSIVIHGISESTAPKSIERANDDYDVICDLLDHLGIECVPQSVYRLGRKEPNKCRLVKVVFPSSFFQKLTIKRATRLPSTPYRGAFIRPSLSKEERDRNREARRARCSSSQDFLYSA